MTPSASPRLTPALRFDEPLDLRLDLPPLPVTVTQVADLVARPNDQVDAAALAEVVDGDPVVAAAVLRRINSAYYGMRRRVGSVRRAVMFLGFREVANIVLTAGLTRFGETFSTSGHTALFDRIMEMNIGAGQYARVLARLFELPVEGQAYSAGLLHTVGRLIFLYNYPDEYVALEQKRSDRALPTRLDEKQLFGADHLTVGKNAAEEWNLPPLITQVIGYYRNPNALEASEDRLVAALVGAASGAAVQLMAQREGLASADMPDALQWSGPIETLARAADTDPERITEAIAEEEEAVAFYVATMMGD